MVTKRLASTILLGLSMGLVSGCQLPPGAQAEHDLVGNWHAGTPCDSSLRLEVDGSARGVAMGDSRERRR